MARSSKLRSRVSHGDVISCVSTGAGGASSSSAPASRSGRVIAVIASAVAVWLSLGQTSPARAQESPSSVTGQLQEDERAREDVTAAPVVDRVLAPYFDFKKRIQERFGLSFATDYNVLFQGATESPGEHIAAAGTWRFFGRWELIGRESGDIGSFFYKVENRHILGTEVPPVLLGPEVGSVPGTAGPFSDAGWLLTNLFWQQRLFDRKLVVIAGQIDVTDFVDPYALSSPWIAFSHQAFLTNPTIAAPNPGLGAAAGVFLFDNIIVSAGFADANADPSEPFDGPFSDGEFFTTGSVTWISSFERRYFDNIHLTGWHSDARKKEGVPEGWGLTASASWRFRERWVPFLRGGYANGEASQLEGHVAAGVGLDLRANDQLGFGFAWGSPADRALRDQYTFELFYRLQAFGGLAITPDVQLIVNPASNPREGAIAVFGIRARLAL